VAGFRIALTGSWAEARRRYANAQRDARQRLVLALKRAAILLEGGIKRGLASSAPGGIQLRPLSPFTLLQRKGGGGNARPLLDTGTMLGSIHSSVDAANLRGFVGISRGARAANGTDLVEVATVHEFGSEPFSIPVTDALRRFFLAMSIKSGGQFLPLAADKRYIYHPGVPARPFVQPVLTQMRPIIAQELRATFNG
jgi:hypothetical protein